MKKRTKILLIALIVVVLLVSAVAIANSVRGAYAQVQPVQLVVGTNNNVVASGTITNQRFGVRVSEPGFVHVRLPNQNSSPHSVDSVHFFDFTQEGTYTIFRFSPRSNLNTFVDLDIQITLDTTAPEITIFADGNSVVDGGFTQGNVSASVTDNLSGVRSFDVRVNGGAFIPYTNQVFAEDGVYEFRAVDYAGNESRARVTRDTVAPIVNIFARGEVLENYALTNAVYIEVMAEDELSGLVALYVRKPNGGTFTRFELFTLQFTDSGRYEIFAVDRAGNQSVLMVVTVDNILPIISVTHEGIVLENGAFINGNLITFHVDKLTATGFVRNIVTNETTVILNSATITEEGQYVFWAVDMAGNESNEMTVTIDRTPKAVSMGNVANGKTTREVVLSWTDSLGTAPIVSVTVNGIAVQNGITIQTIDSGVYNIKSIDAAGNKWTDSFVAFRREVLSATLNKIFYETVDSGGNRVALESWDNAVAFAIKRENALVRFGTWYGAIWDGGIPMDSEDSVNAQNGIFFIYKRQGNPNQEVAYFTLERLNAVIAEFAIASVRAYYWWQRVPTQIADGNDLHSLREERIFIGNSVALAAHANYLINGIPFTNLVLAVEGVHTLTVFDDFGNSYEYTLIIVRTPPNILFRFEDGVFNTADINIRYNLQEATTLRLGSGLGSEFSMLIVRNALGDILAIIHYGEEYTLSVNGRFFITSINHAGVSSEFQFTISLNPPTISFEENRDTNRLEVRIYASTDFGADMTNIRIDRFDEGGATWLLLERDSVDRIINAERTFFEFSYSGLYRVIVEDNFRSAIGAVIAKHSFVTSLAPPTVQLSIQPINGYINAPVYLTFSNIYTARIYKYDILLGYYESGTVIAIDGFYMIIVTDNLGGKTIVSFTLDTTPPTIELVGVVNGGRTSGSVIIRNPSEPVIMQVYLNGELIDYTLGEELTEIGLYHIVLIDNAGNKTEYSFEIIYSFNAAAVIFMVLLLLGIIGAIIFLLVKKKKLKLDFLQKIFKKKPEAEKEIESEIDQNAEDETDAN